MDADWIKSPAARRILMHWADPRPAWLWSHDGTTLLWRNPAARYFGGRVKKHGLRLAPEAVPIKGQIARLIRLGSVGRSSLSRLQFLAGEKPVSTTCACTPLEMADGELALLLVGVDPIDAELLEASPDAALDRMPETLFAAGADYLVIEGGEVRAGSMRAREEIAPYLEGLPEDETLSLDGQTIAVTRYKASPTDATLLLFGTRASRIDTVRAAEGEAVEPAEKRVSAETIAEPLLPMGLPAQPVAETPAPLPPSDEWVEPIAPPAERSLSSLFDRLADDAGLYTSLTAADEVFVGAPAQVEEPIIVPVQEADLEAQPDDMIASIIEFHEPEDSAADVNIPMQWRIIGRGFTPLPPPEEEPVETAPAEQSPAEPAPFEAVNTIDAAPDIETAERVSRYNFEELGRILTDRVSGEAPPPEPPRAAPSPNEGVINLNADTWLLNRLPLGIVVFRDQQVLFANRALTEMIGHEGVEGLRAAGIGAIFPPHEGAGPITQLMRRDGTALPVTARLQSLSWQGKPALMLTAAASEPKIGHEGAVRAFAEIAADAREEGFVTADRSGVITLVSGHGRVLLGTTESDLTGKPLTAIVAAEEAQALREFLERPARFAETARPSLIAAVSDRAIELALFAEGQAGIVTGYFGFLRKRLVAPVVADPDGDVEPSMLGRLSRGIRRPLNTIIGFADLIRSSAFGPDEVQRYVEYARDIKTAGDEIALLVDELDDFARLRDGRYAPRPADVDLMALLESCSLRVKGQAGAARVLVRSAISERLPRIRADRASLGQAVLNLLASAIDQTPPGGSVILSAQWQDDGGIAVHVRDGSAMTTDMGERFVVFRDGVGKDGEQLSPVRSSVGLALTRSLLAVNACSLSVDPTAGVGTLFSMVIPAELIVQD